MGSATTRTSPAGIRARSASQRAVKVETATCRADARTSERRRAPIGAHTSVPCAISATGVRATPAPATATGRSPECMQTTQRQRRRARAPTTRRANRACARRLSGTKLSRPAT